MDSSGPPSSSDRIGLHRLIEQYTPNSAIGRLLLAAAAGVIGGFTFWLALVGVLVGGLLSGLFGLAAAGVALGMGVLIVVTLWPVYLSLIGNVESATAYSDRIESSATERDDGPVALLQRRYANGEIPEAEFERRLDELLDADERSRASERSTRDEAREELTELE